MIVRETDLDARLTAAVRDRVLRRGLWLDPADFTVDVHGGRVRIGGVVERRAAAALIGRMIAGLDGVSEVEVDLAWIHDA
jgi:osmotically-inducible protein OsmY